MSNAPTRRLGRGLDALLGEYSAQNDDAEAGSRAPSLVPLAWLQPNARNPRQSFPAEDLNDLAASIREHGLVQPIVVRPVEGETDQYEIIAGERRWRAAQKAELHEVPIIVLEADDKKALELAIVENVQRSDLNPIEEARGYDALMQEFHYTQADLGQTIGKSRAHVANVLRLLTLPESVQKLVREGVLSSGHARALVTANEPEKLAQLIVSKGLSVRETERRAHAASEDSSVRKSRRRPVKDADTRLLERELSEQIDAKLMIDHRPNGGGEIRIRYRTLDDLDRLCTIIGG